MPAIIPNIRIDRASLLARFFMPHQMHWIQAEDVLHAHGRQAFALAEKSVRIGWTYADAFKNVRKRLHYKNRDYLFATKDYHSALEYMRLCKQMADFFNSARFIVSYGEECHKVPRLDQDGRPSGFTDELKMGVIRFDNGSAIRAFSSHPQAMAVYGGDVGLDEFAKHSNARLLWETAQGRVTWNFDMAVWSSHDGEDTLFNQFALQARTTAALTLNSQLPISNLLGPPINSQTSPAHSPWNLYYCVTILDAIELGLLDVINRIHGTCTTPAEFVASCRSRAGLEEVFQQAYMCNPLGAATNHIVDWSAIERCRYDYEITRLHFDHAQIIQQFGDFCPGRELNREQEITSLIHNRFLKLFQTRNTYRLGFDVAASGQGDLAVIYIDELIGEELWLRALFTCRTEDWHFIKTVLFTFLRELSSVQAAGDETGLGKQICWEARYQFGGIFAPINFSAKKHDIGFSLMNQLSSAQKRFPRTHQDIAADFFALRKSHTGTRWIFSEGRNDSNPASHCDIAWAAALATEAHLQNRFQAGAMVC